MPEGFVPLAGSLRGGATMAFAAHAEPADKAQAPPDSNRDGIEALLDALALARLAALEAFDRAAPRLLAALAQNVLGRELELAPADLRTLVAQLRRDFAAAEPVAVLLAPSEAGCRIDGLPVRADPALCAGDIVLEVRDGEIDARFALRRAGTLGTALAPA
jgi:flagellar biosynthesis/type III secretory pathway protein FliH